MSNTKKNRPKKKKPRRRITKRTSRKQHKSPWSFSSVLRKSWKYVIGISVLLAIAVAIKTLFYSDNTEDIAFDQPRFSEQIEHVEFSFGESGMTFGSSVARLQKEAVWPCKFSEFKPVKLYMKDNLVYADVEVYGGSGLPPIRIIGNKLFGKPSHWDFNSNDKAIEIVNSKGKPVYQFYYKTPSHIVVNGIFPYPGGFILARPKGGALTVMNANALIKLNFKPIFKYPSWKYPGEYAD